MSEEFDYIVIGAGTAGSTLAARLSEDGSHRVLLLEAGSRGLYWRVDMPMAVGTLFADRRRNWHYHSEPEAELGGRVVDHPRGRMLGGSSSINGMVYTRGHALDYDHWAFGHGCAGWSYADVLPYFRRTESFAGGEDQYRGASGPLHVTTPDIDDNALNKAFIEAGREAGYPLTDGQNGFQQEGFGVSETTIWKGRRWGAARAFILPAMRRANLSVATDCHVERIVVSEGRAHSVAYRRNGRPLEARATKEILVSAGAFGSPQLLMLSGIGPAAHLRDHGIDVVRDAPGVGRNLQDHPDLILQQWCREPVSLYPVSQGIGKIATGARWILTRGGPAASNQFHVSAFIRTAPGIEHPDLKLELLPVAVAEDMAPLKGHAFQVHMTMMRAASRGFLELKSRNPADHPAIHFNYLSDPSDVATFVRALRLTREILGQPTMAQFAGEEIAPGPSVQTDAEIEAWARKCVGTAYHPAGTCRMGGPDDIEAVLDPDLKVRGVDGLRVVDASVMPMIISANINAPTFMIAEKAADMILGRPAPPRVEAPFWRNRDWQEAQR